MRNITTGIYGIELDGMPGGQITGVQFPSKSRPVADIAVGHALSGMRTVGNIEIKPLKFKMSLASAKKPMIDKLKVLTDRKSDNGGAHRWNGAIHTADTDGNIKETCTFRDGLVTKFEFVTLDVAGKEPVMMEIEITPEDFTIAPGSGKVAGESPAIQKKHINSNFRLTAAGLEGKDCTKIAGLNVTQDKVVQMTGETIVGELQTAGLKYSQEVTIDILARSVKSWQDWKKNFCDDGNIMDEKSMDIELLDPSGKETLFKIVLMGCGITDLSMPQLEMNKNASAIWTAKMYIEGMEFLPG